MMLIMFNKLLKPIKLILFICLSISLNSTILAKDKDVLKVGVLVAQSGPAGLFGPASKNLAKLAQEQINARGGILDKPIKLFFVDVGAPLAQTRQAVLKLWKKEKIDVFVGMHNSAIRNALTGLFMGKVPYIYTATHSGGECSKGTYIIGETPSQQLKPVIPWIAKNKNIKKWYLIGNDYVWPRSTNAKAKTYIESTGGTVVGEEYLPFTVKNFDANLEKIKNSGADAVLITLVGGAAVGFNRGFGMFGLDKSILRLGTLLEANTLAGTGVQNSKNIYSVSGYFANIKNKTAKAFKKQYKEYYGTKAPALSSLAESVYEGILFLEAIAKKSGTISVEAFSKNAEGASFNGPRGKSVMNKRHINQNIYLAKASSKTAGEFNIIKTFINVDSGATCSND